ncbi:MAG: DUF3443 family protein [Terracidiphilus sp.]
MRFADSLRVAPFALAIAALTLAPAARAQAPGDDSAAYEPMSFAGDAASTTGCGSATNFGSGNTAVLYVDGYPCVPADYPDYDQPYTNVKICAPGSTTNCQVIDHVIVDSGSVGVRFIGSTIKKALLSALPAVTEGPNPITECEIYVSSFIYGPLKKADIYWAGKVARNFPVQIGGAAGFPIPTDCSSQGGSPTNDTASFDSNGLIGVAFPLVDTGIYYTCNSKGAKCAENYYGGIPNLIGAFSSDNNGVTMTMPQISLNGSATPAIGSLVFGVGTEANNKPPAGTVPLFNNSDGLFHMQIGSSKATAYIDSGTNTMSIAGTYPVCTDPGGNGFFCPKSNTPLAVGMYSISQTKPQFTVGYTMGNGSALLNLGYVAYNDLVGIADSSTTAGNAFALGLSNFFGHTMYFVFNSRKSSLGTGPINAVSPQK